MPRVARAVVLIGLTLLVGVSFAYSVPRTYLGSMAVFLGAGRLASLGQNPYGIADITPHGPDGVPYPNLSPPLSVLVFQQIAWVDPTILFLVWYVVGLSLYLVILYAFVRGLPGQQSTIRILWALAIFPFWFTLGIGQVEVELLALVTVAWLALPARRDVLAGIAIGILIAWKPNFVLWPVALFLAGRRQVCLTAAGVSVALSLWPALVYGPTIYRQWLDATVQTTNGIGGYGLISFIANASGVPWLGLPLSAVIIISTLWWAWRARPSAERAGEVAITVTLLALPVTNAAYFVLLVPVFLGRAWNAAMIAAACLLLIPWQLFMAGRLPWPYAIVLFLLLGYPSADTRLQGGIASVRHMLSRRSAIRHTV